MKPFRYHSVNTLTEAVELLNSYRAEAKVLAGGTDLLVEMKEGILAPRHVINLKSIPSLNQIRLENQVLKIGALTTIHEIEAHPLLLEHAGILARAASLLGSLQIRNKGTIGGNLCHASPAADLAPPLLALEAKVEIVGNGGRRMEDLEEFFIGPGVTTLQPDEILTEIHFSLPSAGTRGVYLKFSPRKAMDLAVVGVAALLTAEETLSLCTRARIAFGAVAPTPARAKRAERMLEGKRISRELLREVSAVAADESQPISDLRASAGYRREMVRVLVEQGIAESFESTHAGLEENRRRENGKA
jgi:aerobic carbon-monoxide dehydrogenase medium subunit